MRVVCRIVRPLHVVVSSCVCPTSRRRLICGHHGLNTQFCLSEKKKFCSFHSSFLCYYHIYKVLFVLVKVKKKEEKKFFNLRKIFYLEVVNTIKGSKEWGLYTHFWLSEFFVAVHFSILFLLLSYL